MIGRCLWYCHHDKTIVLYLLYIVLDHNIQSYVLMLPYMQSSDCIKLKYCQQIIKMDAA